MSGNSIFEVIYKEGHDKSESIKLATVTVFNIRNDKNGYPQFLIYYQGQWKYVSAKYCIPRGEIVDYGICKRYSRYF